MKLYNFFSVSKEVLALRQINYREPTPPNEELIVRSKVVKVKDNAEKVGSGKPSVHVDLSLHQVPEWCALAEL